MLERSVSDDSFTVRNLPPRTAYQCTDDNNEIAFRFAPVHCTVDESDGSFVIRADGNDQLGWRMPVRQYIVQTGNIDNKGRYSFTDKSSWAKNNVQTYADDSNADETYYGCEMYFYNEIMHKIKQRKLLISV